MAFDALCDLPYTMVQVQAKVSPLIVGIDTELVRPISKKAGFLLDVGVIGFLLVA